MRSRLSLGVAASVLAMAAAAHAASFDITIKNTTTTPWTQGLLTLTPLISLGMTPRPGTSAYATYAFVTNACNVSDSFCGSGCNDDGNAAVLAARWGLSLNSNAWIFPALAAGSSATVTIDAPAGARLSYIARDSAGVDDAIILHQVGSTSTLSAPLYNASGQPLSPVAFALDGYDVNTVNSAAGSAASCTGNLCPIPATTSCYVALGNGGATATIPAQPATSASYTKVWTYTEAGYTTDGIALGDVGGASTANELVVLLEGAQSAGTYDPTARGRALVLDRTGAMQTRFDAASGHDLMGFPLIEDINGTGKLDFLVSEFLPATPLPGGGVYAATGSTSIWTSTGYGYPGFWNMGPSSGDVRSDQTGVELVVPTWGGDIAVLSRSNAATLNTYSLYSTAGEILYGHVALANITGTSASEVIAFGGTSGKVFVLQPNATGGGMTVAWSSTPPAGLYAFGSGPAVGDLDGDGKPEIVVASAGTGRVYAYDPSNAALGGGCKYQWLAPGGFDYAWSSPVIGNVTGSTTTGVTREVVVMSSDSVLSVLSIPTGTGSGCRSGTVWSHVVGNGGPAWFTPALGNVTGGANLDVVVASYTTLEVVDVAAQTVAYSMTDSSASFYPSAVIERGSTSAPGASIYVSGWINSKVYRIDTPTGAPVPALNWSTFMGDNTRTGSR